MFRRKWTTLKISRILNYSLVLLIFPEVPNIGDANISFKWKVKTAGDLSTQKILVSQASSTLDLKQENREVIEKDASVEQNSNSSKQVCEPQPYHKEEVPIPILPSDEMLFDTISVTGNTVLSKEEIVTIVKDTLQSQNLDDNSIKEILKEKLIFSYTQKGYFFQTINDSTLITIDPKREERLIVIDINEKLAGVNKIELEGLNRLNKSYICERIKLARMIPFDIRELENQLKLLRFDPLLSYVEAKLRVNTEQERILTVVIRETPFLGMSLGTDNFSPPTLGGERFGLSNLRFRNLTGMGDELSGVYYHSTTGGADVLDITYSVPLNAMNGSIQLKVSPNSQEITQAPFDQFDIREIREYYEITYRQPLLRTPQEEFAISIGFTHEDGQTFIFDNIGVPFGLGPEENGVSRTSVFKIGQDYVSRDSEGSWSMRSQFNIGTGIWDATINDSPIPDGLFFSWLGQAQRVQILNDDHLLIIQADLQLSPDGLLPTERFIMGGGTSVRGYRQNVRSGDNGFRLSIEDRMTVLRDAAGTPTIQIAPFLDMGYVWNAGDNPNPEIFNRFLIGAGLGFLWERPLGVDGLSLRLDYGIPFVDLEDRGDNIQDDGLYFRVNYQLFP